MTRSGQSAAAAGAAAIVSAAAHSALFPPFDRAWLAWIALVPLCVALRFLGAPSAAGCAWLFMSLATAGAVSWLIPTLHDHFGQPFSVAVGFWLALSVLSAAPFFALMLSAASRVKQRVPGVLFPVAVAAAWAASEYARASLGVRTPWMLLGGALYDEPQLRQIARLGGVYAGSALIAYVNAAIAETAVAIWRARSFAVGARHAAPALASGAGLVLAAWLYGARALSFETQPDAPPQIAVAVVQGNAPSELLWTTTGASRVVGRYVRMTRSVLQDQPVPDLVVWPENAIQTPVDDLALSRSVASLARFAPLLTGAPHHETRGGATRTFNSTTLLRTDRTRVRYDKRRLLPFSETQPLAGFGFGTRGDLDAAQYSAGAAPGLFELGPQRLGVLICMEALYPELAREAALLGASVLVVPSNDGWYLGSGGGRQHLNQVVFRAIETGLPLVRATSTGVSALVAPDGTIDAELGTGEEGVLRGETRQRLPLPLYARVGDVFAITCLLITLGAALVPLAPAQRKRTTGAGFRRVASERLRSDRTRLAPSNLRVLQGNARADSLRPARVRL